MMRTVCSLLLLVFCAIGGTNAQEDCVPLGVVNVSISPNSILTWEVSPEETCELDYFIVDIQFTFGEIEETSATALPQLSIAHLPPCEVWIFTIIPVSRELITGASHHLFSKVPMAPGTNLSLIITNATHEEDYLVLRWTMANASNTDCADLYRVTVIDENSDHIADIITSDMFEFIRHLAPCGRYEFSVRAIHRAIPESEGPLATLIYDEPARSIEPPHLESITYGTTSFNSIWQLENFQRNRCQVTAFHVDGSPYFNFTYPINDSPLRPHFALNVNNLLSNRLYIFWVSVENSAGLSVPIPLAVQTEAGP